MNDTSAWIETFRGHRFHLLDPRPEEIEIEDIAHALSMQVRFTGHVKKFYSVAEHCYQVSLLMRANDSEKLWGLLHDASEAYITDLSRPVKYMTPIGPPYFEIEEGIMRAVAEKFGLVWPVPSNVKLADNILLWTEKEQLMSGVSWDNEEIKDWDTEKQRAAGYINEAPGYKDVNRASKDIHLACYRPETIEKLFLQKFYDLA